MTPDRPAIGGRSRFASGCAPSPTRHVPLHRVLGALPALRRCGDSQLTFEQVHMGYTDQEVSAEAIAPQRPLKPGDKRVSKLAQRTRARSANGRGDQPSRGGQPSMDIREVVGVTPSYLSVLIDRKPTPITSVAPTDDGGRILEVEVVEDWRIPSSADILALYQIELDADGDMSTYRRTRRDLRDPVAVRSGCPQP